MVRLIVMRHAKSSWDDATLADHERPLNARGRRDAPRIAGALIERGWWPEVVLASDSARTRETWERMVPLATLMPEVHWLPELYHAGLRATLGALDHLPPDTSDVLVLGHNPGWEHVVEAFGGRWERMPTAAAALLHHDEGDWGRVRETLGEWRLDGVLRPKTLDDGA